MRRLAIALGLVAGIVFAGLLAAATAAPRIPERVHGIMGPIRVELVDRIILPDSLEAFGAYDPVGRRILLRRGYDVLFLHAVLAHEECHAALIDYGLATIPMPLQQQICNAFGAARVAGLR